MEERNHLVEETTEVRSLPRIGSKAPQFEALTTHGTLKLSDYKGSWLILFSHPADFTPVCTTEFVGFQKIYPELRKMNTELLGLSIDSVHSHIAWVRNIKENFGVDIEFPVIADLNKDVAEKYGMIMPEESSTEASRAVFVIDPDQVVRAIIYYPLSTGRNMDEMIRLVTALQATDEHQIATPADWRKGDKVIVPPAATTELAEERVNDDSLECVDWYFCKKEL
ncbi:peroxiredoxin (alkyl hydroperoxide reductase subunit C) [Cerasibacillus quisquiliarum]|uniref:Peroxiredoxin n=1 Tax=Cerasibacillus quisquiliarum TaxID=227865 RepID=A0A511V2V5_9BACI|nr:peroxiredoxin [Cerasibacillus quisquiliarum]MBB5146853.1 peroxiredoxin (alkyl hydroperoxide reductase subunit C) [Cerasibacillus quisquiliarum]GEN31652.1 peroxiredoxin [Cerasibacillus quisquiliarum]